MNSRFVSSLVAGALCCSCAVPFHRTPAGDYTVDGPGYVIAALPGGALMPPGWKLSTYEEREGKFTRSDRYDDSDLSLRREGDPGVLTISSDDFYSCPWVEDPANCEARRAAEDDRFGERIVGYRGALSYRLSRGNHTALLWKRPRNIPGADGFELVVDILDVNNKTLERVYRFVFRRRGTKSNKHSMLMYESPLETFDDGVKDVSALIDRISFK